MKLTLAEIIRAVGGTCIASADRLTLTGVSIDSRKVCPDDLFVCLPGSRVDGHEFAPVAEAAGAKAFLASKAINVIEPVVLVPDTGKALMALGTYGRSLANGKVVAVTGSAGKTTVKEFVFSILSQDRAVAKNYKNFNNQIGLPLSILAAKGDEGAWVLEAGISQPGDMDELGPIVSPDVAVIHNIDPAHLEGLGSIQGVARAKASLLKYMKPGGQGLVSMDYPELWDEARKISPSVIGFSAKDENARYSCLYLGTDDAGQGRFELRLNGRSTMLSLPFRGSHFAENIAAAAAVADILGSSIESISRGLAEAVLPDQRFRCLDVQGWTVIDDTYNANPLSMKRAIESACDLANGRPVVLVLGEMGELGNEADSEHRELGCCIGRTGCCALFFHGGQFSNVRKGLSDGKWSGEAIDVDGPEGFLEGLRKLGVSGGVILFKGSRSKKMELFFNAFTNALMGGKCEAGA